jgi:hypothetical protein
MVRRGKGRQTPASDIMERWNRGYEVATIHVGTCTGQWMLSCDTPWRRGRKIQKLLAVTVGGGARESNDMWIPQLWWLKQPEGSCCRQAEVVTSSLWHAQGASHCPVTVMRTGFKDMRWHFSSYCGNWKGHTTENRNRQGRNWIRGLRSQDYILSPHENRGPTGVVVEEAHEDRSLTRWPASCGSTIDPKYLTVTDIRGK